MKTINEVNFQMIVQGSETYLDLHSQYGQSELTKGCRQMNEVFNRRLDVDAKEEFAELLEELQNEGKGWFIERIDWLLNGSYGSEVHFYLLNQCEMIFSGKTGKNFNRAFTSFAKVCIQCLALLDFSSLNYRKLAELFRKLSPETNNAIIEATKKEIEEYFTSE